MVVFIAMLLLGLALTAAGVLAIMPDAAYRFFWKKRVFCRRCRLEIQQEELRALEKEDENNPLAVPRE